MVKVVADHKQRRSPSPSTPGDREDRRGLHFNGHYATCAVATNLGDRFPIGGIYRPCRSARETRSVLLESVSKGPSKVRRREDVAARGKIVMRSPFVSQSTLTEHQLTNTDVRLQRSGDPDNHETRDAKCGILLDGDSCERCSNPFENRYSNVRPNPVDVGLPVPRPRELP